MTNSTSLNPAALERLRKWGGDKLAAQMVRLFLDNSGGRMDQIRGGVAAEDPDEAEKGAHSLKSSAANVGAESGPGSGGGDRKRRIKRRRGGSQDHPAGIGGRLQPGDR